MQTAWTAESEQLLRVHKVGDLAHFSLEHVVESAPTPLTNHITLEGLQITPSSTTWEFPKISGLI